MGLFCLTSQSLVKGATQAVTAAVPHRQHIAAAMTTLIAFFAAATDYPLVTINNSIYWRPSTIVYTRPGVHLEQKLNCSTLLLLLLYCWLFQHIMDPTGAQSYPQRLQMVFGCFIQSCSLDTSTLWLPSPGQLLLQSPTVLLSQLPLHGLPSWLNCDYMDFSLPNTPQFTARGSPFTVGDR